MAVKPGWEGRFFEDFEVGDDLPRTQIQRQDRFGKTARRRKETGAGGARIEVARSNSGGTRREPRWWRSGSSDFRS